MNHVGRGRGCYRAWTSMISDQLLIKEVISILMKTFGDNEVLKFEKKNSTNWFISIFFQVTVFWRRFRSTGVRSGSVRGSFRVCSEPVRDPFGVRSGPFRVRSKSVWAGCFIGAPQLRILNSRWLIVTLLLVYEDCSNWHETLPKTRFRCFPALHLWTRKQFGER